MVYLLQYLNFLHIVIFNYVFFYYFWWRGDLKYAQIVRVIVQTNLNLDLFCLPTICLQHFSKSFCQFLLQLIIIILSEWNYFLQISPPQIIDQMKLLTMWFLQKSILRTCLLYNGDFFNLYKILPYFNQYCSGHVTNKFWYLLFSCCFYLSLNWQINLPWYLSIVHSMRIICKCYLL